MSLSFTTVSISHEILKRCISPSSPSSYRLPLVTSSLQALPSYSNDCISDLVKETDEMVLYEPYIFPQRGGESHQVGERGVNNLDDDIIAEGVVTDLAEVHHQSGEPTFAGPIPNVTVNVGREAVLECHVENLRQYKVMTLQE